MKKIRKTIALALMLSIVTAMNGQIFIAEDNMPSRYGTEDISGDGIIPLNGGLLDQTNEIYTPIGDGLLLLVALGSVYLLTKKGYRVIKLGEV